MRRLLILPVGLLLLLFGAMHFSGTDANSKADFTFVNRGDIKTLDVSKMSFMQDIRMSYALYEGLYTPDPVTLDPVPGCAFPIEISDDKKTYTFHIRPEAKWSNGDDVVAADFLFAWKRISDSQAEYSGLLRYVDGIDEYQDSLKASQKAGYKGPDPDFSKVKIETRGDDPKYLRVHLKNPTTYFPDMCAFTPYFPIYEKCMYIKDSRGQVVYDENHKPVVDKGFTKPDKLVCNGPYRLAEWDFKKRLRLVAQDHYWNKATVKSHTVDMLIFDDQQNALTAYETGAADWLAEVQGDYAHFLLGKNRSDLHVFDSFGTYFYSFNCQEKFQDGSVNPLHDMRVRKALCMSVDKQYIVDYITRIGEKTAGCYIPPGVFPGYESPVGLPKDLAKAKALMAEAGFPDGAGFPRLKILFNTEEVRHKEIAIYLQRQWKERLNIDLDLDAKENKTFGNELSNKKYAIARASWYGDYADPSTFTDKYMTGNGNNDADWSNPKFDDLCKQAAGAPPAGVKDVTKWRLDLFHQAEEIMLNEAPILPLFSYKNAYMFRKNVSGIQLNSRQMIMLHSVKVSKP